MVAGVVVAVVACGKIGGTTSRQTETDSSKRIYYKLPSQLKKHHKKHSLENMNAQQCFIEGYAAGLEPFRDLLSNDKTHLKRSHLLRFPVV
jgi:hypothetical protein